MEDLRQHLIERKLTGVAYLGLERQLDWIEASLGLIAIKEQPCFPTVVELVESRNCMVHGRAKVSDKFIKALAVRSFDRPGPCSETDDR